MRKAYSVDLQMSFKQILIDTCSSKRCCTREYLMEIEGKSNSNRLVSAERLCMNKLTDKDNPLPYEKLPIFA